MKRIRELLDSALEATLPAVKRARIEARLNDELSALPPEMRHLIMLNLPVRPLLRMAQANGIFKETIDRSFVSIFKRDIMAHMK
jgi:hypothetical protein